MPFDAQFNKLFRMAAKKPIAEFQQAVHTGKELKTVTDPRTKESWSLTAELHKNVTGGFCMGASLDWLRKVLQNEKRGVTHLKRSRVTRMAQTHDKQRDVMKRTAPSVAAKREQATGLESEAKSAAETSTRARDEFEKDVKQWIEANGGSWNEGNPRMRGTPDVLKMFDEKWDLLEAMRAAVFKRHNELIEQAGELREQANVEVMKISSAEKRAELWDAIAKELDADSGKTRKFSGICPVASCGMMKWASFKDYLVAALSAPGFRPGRGLLLSLSLEPAPGHAIALYRESSTTTLLFDANLGVYKFESLALLVHGLVILTEVGYVGRDSDGKVTALGDEHSWQVFCKTDGVLPVLAGAEGGLATGAEIMLAYDAARETIDFSIEMAQELMEQTLREARQLSDAYNANKTPTAQKAWVAAHNESVKTVLFARGDSNQAKTLYPAWSAEEITIV